MRTCYNCKEGEDTEVDMEKDLYQKIPMWYKKAGNYSLLPKSLNCKKKYNRNKTKFKKGTPKLGNEVKLDHKIKEKNTWIFYWASKPSNNHHKINDPETAYGNEKNSGLIKSDKKGKLTFILSCPQPYKIDEVTYPRHIHYTTLKKIKKKGEKIFWIWNEKVKAVPVRCVISKKELDHILKEEKHIVINALKTDKNIPGSDNLPVDSINKSNRDEKINNFIQAKIKENEYLSKLIDNNNLDNKDVPIVAYCANEKCNASDTLVEHLINTGYANVVEYEGCLDEWFGKEIIDDDTIDEVIDDDTIDEVIDDDTIDESIDDDDNDDESIDDDDDNDKVKKTKKLNKKSLSEETLVYE